MSGGEISKFNIAPLPLEKDKAVDEIISPGIIRELNRRIKRRSTAREFEEKVKRRGIKMRDKLIRGRLKGQEKSEKETRGETKEEKERTR